MLLLFEAGGDGGHFTVRGSDAFFGRRTGSGPDPVGVFVGKTVLLTEAHHRIRQVRAMLSGRMETYTPRG